MQTLGTILLVLLGLFFLPVLLNSGNIFLFLVGVAILLAVIGYSCFYSYTRFKDFL